jgi:hypothetical protein
MTRKVCYKLNLLGVLSFCCCKIVLHVFGYSQIMFCVCVCAGARCLLIHCINYRAFLYIDIVIVPNCVNFYAMCCALTILGKCLSTVQLL